MSPSSSIGALHMGNLMRYFQETHIVPLGEFSREEFDLENTPGRASKALEEMLSGYADNPKAVLRTFPSKGRSGRVHLEGLVFNSVCAHHLLPFHGSIDILYVPKDQLIGLSKAQRLVSILSRRLQLQESLTADIARIFYEGVKPEYVAVRATATHSCIVCRGVKNPQMEVHTEFSCGSLMPSNLLHKMSSP